MRDRRLAPSECGCAGAFFPFSLRWLMEGGGNAVALFTFVEMG
jgi:hypothetical protein